MKALRRYTNLPAVLRMLSTRKITLLSPDTWDDLNDRRLLEAYRRGSNLESVLCLCFAEAAETYHHWKVFAHGTDGVCVVFDKDRLLSALPKDQVRHQAVRYYTVSDLKTAEPALEELPFSKRAAYKAEDEYRLLWTSATKMMRTMDFEFPINAIDRLIANPWLPKPLIESMEEAIRSFPDCNHFELLQSTVTDGPAWKRLADKYA